MSSSSNPWHLTEKHNLATQNAFSITGGQRGVSSTGPVWIPDSGATGHMTNDSAILEDTEEYEGAEQVMLGHGKLLPINLTSSSKIHTSGTSNASFNLINVLFVPSIKYNLLSIAKFTADNNCSFECLPWGYNIISLQSNQILAQGVMHKNLYSLNSFPVLPDPHLAAYALILATQLLSITGLVIMIKDNKEVGHFISYSTIQ